MTDVPQSDPGALRAALDLALAVGRDACGSVRRLKNEIADAQEAAQADMFWPLALLLVPSRVRRRRRIHRLTALAQANLAALDAAVDVLRGQGLTLPPPVATQGPGSVAGHGSQPRDHDQWAGPLALVQHKAWRVDAVLTALRELRPPSP